MKHSLKIGIALAVVIGLLFTACGGGGGDPSSPSGGGINTALSAPTNVKATEVSETEVTVSWSAVTGATGYWVYYGESTFNFASSTSITLSNLTPNKTYNITVAAENNGSEGPRSSPVSVTPGSANEDDQGDDNPGGNGDNTGDDGGITDPSGDDGNNQGGTDPGNNGGGRKTYPYRLVSTDMNYPAGHITEGAVRVVYSYNSDGSVRQVDEFDKNGNSYTTAMVTNNAAGFPVRTETIYLQQEDYRVIAEIELNSNNRVQRTKYYTYGTFVLWDGSIADYMSTDYSMEYSYSADGRQTEQRYFSGGTLQSTYTYVHDASGRIAGYTIVDHIQGESGSMTYTYTFNADGTVASQSLYASQGLIYTMHYTWEAKPTPVDFQPYGY